MTSVVMWGWVIWSSSSVGPRASSMRVPAFRVWTSARTTRTTRTSWASVSARTSVWAVIRSVSVWVLLKGH